MHTTTTNAPTHNQQTISHNNTDQAHAPTDKTHATTKDTHHKENSANTHDKNENSEVWGINAIGKEKLSYSWIPAVNLNLQYNPDQLGLFFALMVSAIGLMVVLYARAYLGPNPDDLYRFLPHTTTIHGPPC